MLFVLFVMNKLKNGWWNKFESVFVEVSVNVGNELFVCVVICVGFYLNVALASAFAKIDDGRAWLCYFISFVVVCIKYDMDVYMYLILVCYGMLLSVDSWFLFYYEKVRTIKVYIRDVIVVGSYSLLFFGGKIKINYERLSVMCDNWINFCVVFRVVVFFKYLCVELDVLFMEKIVLFDMDISYRRDVVKFIVEVFESEFVVVVEKLVLVEFLLVLVLSDVKGLSEDLND